MKVVTLTLGFRALGPDRKIPEESVDSEEEAWEVRGPTVKS